MNKRILGLAIPNIITNVTIPLLGMIDMAIVGHLSAAHIGAIAIGSQIFNMIYWNCGFLRMGTSGFTAQAFGANDMEKAVRTFIRSTAIALGLALLLIALQWPLSQLALAIFDGSEGVLSMALTYFFVRVWAAPATLSLSAIKGWFIGMQNPKLPMWIAIALNLVNIACSLLFVMVFHWDIAGVALGTVIAQYSGLIMALLALRRQYGKPFSEFFQRYSHRVTSALRDTLRWQEMKGFFKVNGDIFLRSVCITIVFTFVTAASGRISDQVLAIDALIMQFVTLFSYIMDGFAFAGESLVGRYLGARDLRQLRNSVRWLIIWGMIMSAAFTLLYATCGQWILGLFSNSPSIVQGAASYRIWTLAIPLCSFAAFLYDGIYVGATASRAMLISMLIASTTFFALHYGLTALIGVDDSQLELRNHILWASFLTFLALRGGLLAAAMKKAIYRHCEGKHPVDACR